MPAGHAVLHVIIPGLVRRCALVYRCLFHACLNVILTFAHMSREHVPILTQVCAWQGTHYDSDEMLVLSPLLLVVHVHLTCHLAASELLQYAGQMSVAVTQWWLGHPSRHSNGVHQNENEAALPPSMAACQQDVTG